MRFRSFLTLLFISFTTLGLVGCGSSGTNSEFVATGPAAQQNSGSLTFQFQRQVAAQQFFEVDAATTRLRFSFFDNISAAGSAIDTRTVDFASEVTLEEVSTSARSVRITGLDASGIPLYTITQSVTVVAGVDTVVRATSTPVVVSLSNLRLVPANSSESAPLTRVDLEVGGTAQVYLLATYNDGTRIVVGTAASYAPTDEDSELLFSVNSTGLLRGLAAGTGTLSASFGGQSLSLDVTVSERLNSTFSAITALNSSFAPLASLQLSPGEAVDFSVLGVRATDGAPLGVAANSPNLSFTIEGSSLVNVANSQILASPSAVGGELAVITISYRNANASVVTTTIQVMIAETEE